jgi:hypothetical protein
LTVDATAGCAEQIAESVLSRLHARQ